MYSVLQNINGNTNKDENLIKTTTLLVDKIAQDYVEKELFTRVANEISEIQMAVDEFINGLSTYIHSIIKTEEYINVVEKILFPVIRSLKVYSHNILNFNIVFEKDM